MSKMPFAYIVASFAIAVLINLDTFYLLFTFLYSFRCICLPRLVNKVDQNWSDIINGQSEGLSEGAQSPHFNHGVSLLQ